MKEKEKLFKELDKTCKELEKAKAEAEKAKKKEAEKVKTEGKKKLSDKGAAPAEPTGVSMALEEKVAKYEELYETLRNENEVSGYNHKCTKRGMSMPRYRCNGYSCAVIIVHSDQSNEGI